MNLRQSFTSRKRMWAGLFVSCAFVATAGARADAVTDWNVIVERTVVTVDPFLQIRSATIAHVAMFEAVNAILDDYEPYLGLAATRSASPEAAAIAAAHRALSVLHPESKATLDAERERSLAQVLDGPAKIDGIAVGEAAAAAILAVRENDGTGDEVAYTPRPLPGHWRPTPPDLTPAFRPGLGNIVPFALRHGAQFRLRAPPRLRSARYARDYREVRRFGELNSPERPQDRTDVAHYYDVNDPLPVWYPAARQVSEAQGKSLAENARIFALISIAVFDAAVAVFDSKYHYDLWRPVTAIREGDADGNRSTSGDPDWLPLVFTPPFPSYPSGHGGMGHAVRRIVDDAYGRDGHAIVLSSPRVPGVVLHYSSFSEISRDIDDARVYGGVHFRFDQESAEQLGRKVGNYILCNFMRPRRDRHARPSAAPTRAAAPTQSQ